MKHLEFYLSVVLLLIMESNSMLHKRYFRIVREPWLRNLIQISTNNYSPFSQEASDEPNSDDNPETVPGLFEGDIAMPIDANELELQLQNNWRVSWKKDKFPKSYWPNGTVPYVISPLYDIDEYITIYTAIRTMNFMTCLKFVPWNGKQKDYLVIWPIERPKGCWSYVGKQGGPQPIGLQPPDSHGAHCLGGSGRTIHELMHALGIFHEQSRADRDEYVEIHYDNILPKFRSNFVKQSPDNTEYFYEYDYSSVMHYGRYNFGKDKSKPTITPKLPGGRRMGQRRGMTVTDCLKINKIYGCFEGDVYKRRKYFYICKNLGL